MQDNHGEAQHEAMNVQAIDFLDPVARCPKCHIDRMQVIHTDRETMQKNRVLYMNSSQPNRSL
ncbi:MAG: hypothetical protein GXO75_14310 [Calditrichaeota bacterium]|nr:hypothetical protein [Calditrichota bacterium]